MRAKAAAVCGCIALGCGTALLSGCDATLREDVRKVVVQWADAQAQAEQAAIQAQALLNEAAIEYQNNREKEGNAKRAQWPAVNERAQAYGALAGRLWRELEQIHRASPGLLRSALRDAAEERKDSKAALDKVRSAQNRLFAL